MDVCLVLKRHNSQVIPSGEVGDNYWRYLSASRADGTGNWRWKMEPGCCGGDDGPISRILQLSDTVCTAVPCIMDLAHTWKDRVRCVACMRRAGGAVKGEWTGDSVFCTVGTGQIRRVADGVGVLAFWP